MNGATVNIPDMWVGGYEPKEDRTATLEWYVSSTGPVNELNYYSRYFSHTSSIIDDEICQWWQRRCRWKGAARKYLLCWRLLNKNQIPACSLLSITLNYLQVYLYTSPVRSYHHHQSVPEESSRSARHISINHHVGGCQTSFISSQRSKHRSLKYITLVHYR